MVVHQAANVNERCGKIEKSVKNFDQQTLANINNLKSELTEQMKEKLNVISNDKDQKEGLIEISSDHDYDTDKESVSSDRLPTQLKSKEVTIEQTVPSIIVSSKPPEFSPSKDNDFNCKAKTNFENSSFHYQSDLVVLMDSNRRYLELEKLFPESNVRIIPCGNSEKAKSIIAYPRFKEVKAILIHTGTNDLEDIGMDTKSIADNLIQAANEAHEKFPSANIFLSEILPRRDEFNLKGSEVNAILNSAAEHDKFDLIRHSNLARESFFYDRKHLSKYQGVNVLKSNISSSLVKRLPFIKINESSLQSQRPNYFSRTPHGAGAPQNQYSAVRTGASGQNFRGYGVRSYARANVVGEDNRNLPYRPSGHIEGPYRPVSHMEGPLAVQNENVRPHLIQTHSPPYKSSYADVTSQGKNSFKSDVISQGKDPLNQDLMSEMIRQLANMNNTITTLMNINN